MRIDTDLSEDTSKQVQNIADEKGWQKSKAYTEIIRAGTELQDRREQIKRYITDFFKEENPRHEERLEALKDEYGIEELDWIETSMQVIYRGNEYSFSGDPTDIITVNGKSYRMNVCPECSSENTEFHSDQYDDEDAANYSCQSCGAEFDETERDYRVPEQEAEHVKEFSSKRYDLAKYVEGKMLDILDATMGSSGYGSGQWSDPGIYRYDSGFQTVSIPWFCTDPDQIHFSVSNFITDLDSIMNPLYPAAKSSFTDDYLELVREVKAANTDADQVEPIHIDTRGSKPEIIEVRGLSYEDTRVPYRSVGYELEKIQPEEEDLKTSFDGEEIQIELDHDVDEVTWVKVVNEKRVERPQQYEVETDDYYMAISTESLNPIHLIHRETQEPICGEGAEFTTEDERLEREETVSRRGVCSGCLDEYEDF